MNKKVLTVIIIVVLLILFLPVPNPNGFYLDGGTKDYYALTYRIVVWNKITADGSEDGFYKYHKTSVFWFPDNFKSLDDLWEIERTRNQ